jgi:hypothetical protein
LKLPSFRFAPGPFFSWLRLLEKASDRDDRHSFCHRNPLITHVFERGRDGPSRLFPTKSTRAAGDRSGDPRSARRKRTSTARGELRPPSGEGSARSQDRHLVRSLPPGRSFPIESCRIALVANRATWLLQYQAELTYREHRPTRLSTMRKRVVFLSDLGRAAWNRRGGNIGWG